MNNTRQNIIAYLGSQGQVTANELVNYLNISRQALFKHHLSKMINDGVLVKNGRPPKVFYSLNKLDKKIAAEILIDKNTKNILSENYLIITPAGEKKEGVDGFIYWCEKQGLPVVKTAEEYLKTLRKYQQFKKDGLINGLPKIKKTFSKVSLDGVFYLDFYSIERFGKTRMGQLLLYAKQSQDKKLMKEIIDEIKPKIRKVIKKFKIDGIGFIPPTVKRETQLMKVLEKGLSGDLRKVKIAKIRTTVAVPQKTLNKLEDRIENAQNTIVVEENSSFKNILLIDDAVGSGATLNEVAKKIKTKKICKGKVFGLALTGSFKGFDVISEV
jgi:acylphosphatase